jgi:hypothetical protein
MDRDPLTNVNPTNPAGNRRGQTVVHAALVGLATAAFLGGVSLASGLFQVPCCEIFGQERFTPGSVSSSRDLFNKLNLFKNWDRPSMVLVLSGETHGYLQPCGCSFPQYGGLTRRYNLIEALKDQGWPVVAVDLGDIPVAPHLPPAPGPQAMLKYQYAMKALDVMNYTAVGIGEYEMRWWLPSILGEYTLNNPTPKVLAANILKANQKLNANFNGQVFDTELAAVSGAAPKVGVVSLIGPTVEKNIKKASLPLPEFNQNTPAILQKALVDLDAQGAKLNVLLYQGTPDEATKAAEFCLNLRKQNPTFPRLDVVLCLGGDPPPAVPLMVGHTMIISVGHKGRYVGVVGAFPTKNGNPPFELRYQLVSIAPEFETPADKVKGHKLMKVIQDYADDVKNGDYLAKYKQIEHEVQRKDPIATYVGSDACKTCHPDAYRIWKGSDPNHGHAHAYNTLVKAKNPSLRQFDGECVVCHTVGFQYKDGFRNLNKTAFLTDVGCESCHGPCGEHVADFKNLNKRELINPLGYHGKEPETAAQKKVRMQRIDDFCQKCHDLDNDVHWDFDPKWKKIVHMIPRPAPAPAPQGPGLTAPKKE